MGMRFEAFFKEIIDAVSDGIMIVGRDGTILLVNTAMEKLTGYTADELVGSACTVLDCDACELLRNRGGDVWCKLFERDRVKDKRCMVTRKDGGYVSALKSAFVLRGPDGDVFGALETYADMTALDKRDIKIQELTRLLEKDSGFHGILGHSAPMLAVFQLAEKAAQSDATVLITGESGTGKELVAKAIHELGRRKEGPFVKINCAALNEALIESELFGHAKGAFTGAYQHRKGLFEAAHGGDIFLDEIGDIPRTTQAKLLRVLESKQVMRLGDNRTIKVDARFITATNQDLSRMAADGRFREDLLFRINVFPIHVPPLRDRTEDIALLVNTFIHDLRSAGGKRISGVSPAVMDLFMTYEWPGNVRQLRSTLEYAFAVAGPGVIDTQHLPAEFQPVHAARPDTPETVEKTSANGPPGEKEALLDALRRSGGNQTRAAQILGVHRMTVFNRMRKYRIRLQKFDRM